MIFYKSQRRESGIRWEQVQRSSIALHDPSELRGAESQDALVAILRAENTAPRFGNRVVDVGGGCVMVYNKPRLKDELTLADVHEIFESPLQESSPADMRISTDLFPGYTHTHRRPTGEEYASINKATVVAWRTSHRSEEQPMLSMTAIMFSCGYTAEEIDYLIWSSRCKTIPLKNNVVITSPRDQYYYHGEFKLSVSEKRFKEADGI